MFIIIGVSVDTYYVFSIVLGGESERQRRIIVGIPWSTRSSKTTTRDVTESVEAGRWVQAVEVKEASSSLEMGKWGCIIGELQHGCRKEQSGSRNSSRIST